MGIPAFVLCLQVDVIAEIPWFPVVDIAVLFIEDDPTVGPSGTSKFVIQARCEHRPLAAKRMTDDTDPLRINLW